MNRRNLKRLAACAATAVGVLLLLFAASFALPVPVWRTGELPEPPLPIVKNGPAVRMPKRVWIDTDAACGHSRTTDPDDCLALLLLARAPGIEIAGISSVFGNAPLGVTDRTTRDLAAILRAAGAKVPPISRGSGAPWPESGSAAAQPAHAALRKALEEGPLTLLALGPLTNIATALKGRPDLQARVERLVAVMGRRPGHLFHPAEGQGGGMLFGHGPVFRDFNFDQDRIAATSVLAMRLPTTFMPYDAARDVSLTSHDLTTLQASGKAAAWLARRARGWLDFWREGIGRPGFFPFDLLAGAYILEPQLFNCAPAQAWVSEDDRLWNVWFYRPPALLIGLPKEISASAEATSSAIYCVGTDARTHAQLMRWLASPQSRSAPVSLGP